MYKIVAADDERIERMGLTRKLKKQFGDSCLIYEAGNGQEAVEMVRRTGARIVILDIAMPGMNGVEAAEQIRRLDKECSIIFLTAYDDFAYTRKAIIVRALDYLLKPCDENELISVVEEAMRLSDLANAERENVFTQGQRKIPFAKQQNPVCDCGRADDSFKEFFREKSPEDGCDCGIESQGGGSRAQQIAESMRRYVSDNYMKEISMQDAARAMNYSDVYFSRLFKQCFDQNFTAYLTHFRIEKAKELLLDSQVNIKEIGQSVGYGDPNYFAKVFKRITGVIPSEFRHGHNA